jgi:hypothetical protein
MTDPLVERDKKVEKSTPKPAEPARKTDDLAIDLAEEWNQSAENAGDSVGG